MSGAVLWLWVKRRTRFPLPPWSAAPATAVGNPPPPRVLVCPMHLWWISTLTSPFSVPCATLPPCLVVLCDSHDSPAVSCLPSAWTRPCLSPTIPSCLLRLEMVSTGSYLGRFWCHVLWKKSHIQENKNSICDTFLVKHAAAGIMQISKSNNYSYFTRHALRRYSFDINDFCCLIPPSFPCSWSCFWSSVCFPLLFPHPDSK